MQQRARRVLVYTLALIAGFFPLMPFERQSIEFHYALLASCVIWILGGLYVIRYERNAYWRPMFAQKMLASAWVTTVAAAIVLVLDALWLLA